MTFSIAQFVAVLILGCSSFLSGWMLRRIHAKSREAQLQKVLVEAQTTIPPLETNIRNRDQRIASLFAELTEWKTKVPTLEASTKRKDVELLAKDRELKTARVEIDALKATVAATSAIDPTKMAELESIRESLRASQVRCVTLTAEVAERDVRLADARSAVPAFIALPVAPATQTEADLLARADVLASDIAVRDQHIAALQTRLNAEVDLRDALQKTVNADLQARDAEIERVGGEAVKWQARVPKLVATIKARDATVAEHAAALAERDAIVAMREALLTQRELEISERDALIAAAAATLTERDAVSSQRTLEAVARQAELDEQHAVNESLVASLKRSDEQNADVSSQLAATFEQRASLLQSVDERDRAIALLEQRLAAMSRESDTASALNAAKLATALRLGREEVDSHRAALETVNIERDANAALVAQMENARGALEQHLARAREEYARLRGALETELAQANEQRVALERHVDAEQRQRADAATNLESLRQMLSAAQMNLVESDTHRTTLEQHIAQLQSEHASDDQQALEVERAEKIRIAELLEDQTTELVELRDEARDLHTRVAPLESLLKQRDAALFERSEQIETLMAQVDSMRTQNESMQTTLRQRAERIATLERKFSDQPPPPVSPPAPSAELSERRDDQAEQLVVQADKSRELAKVIEERERDRASAAKKNELNEKSMLILKQQLDDARANEERLAAQVRELKSSAQRAPEPDTNGVKVVMSKPKGLFELPPEHIDELQQIRGIGDGFERGLNKLGIYQFSQLAGLSALEIAWIEAHLPTFHGRVERDDWPGQAAALMAASEHAEWSLRAQNSPSLSPRINQ